MNNFFKRSLGLTFLIAAVVGLIFSIVAMVGIWRVRSTANQVIENTIQVLDEETREPIEYARRTIRCSSPGLSCSSWQPGMRGSQ